MSDGVKSGNSRGKYAIFDFYFKIQNDMASGTCVSFLVLILSRYAVSSRFQTHIYTLITL